MCNIYIQILLKNLFYFNAVLFVLTLLAVRTERPNDRPVVTYVVVMAAFWTVKCLEQSSSNFYQPLLFIDGFAEEFFY